MTAVKQRMAANQTEGLTKDDFTGEFLHLAGQNYWASSEVSNRMAAKIQGVVRAPKAMVGFFAWDVKVVTSFGVPIEATIGGMSTDVDVLVQNVVPASGASSDATAAFVRASAMSSSRLEGSHWGVMLQRGTGPDNGISAIHAIDRAARTGQRIFTVEQSNASALRANLSAYDPQVRQDIENGLATGKRITISEGAVTLGSWTGVGYIVEDPTTGAGAYKIAGGQNGGGYNCDCFHLPPLLELLAALLVATGFVFGAPLLAAVLAIVLIAAVMISAWCKIDSAKCLSDDNRDLLKSVMAFFLLVGIVALFTPLAWIAAVAAIVLMVVEIALLDIQIKIMEMGNQGTVCNPV
jgi:hypothetical protein